MKQFWNFVRKELIHILRDPLTLLILIGMPIVEMIIFGFALNMDVKNIRTAVLDESRDGLSRNLILAIENNPLFIYKGILQNQSQADDLLKGDKVDLVIQIPKNLEEKVVAGNNDAQISIVTDATNANIGQVRYIYVQNMLLKVLKDYSNERGTVQGVPYQIETKTRMLFNPTLLSTYNFVPGVMGMVLIIICTLMTSVSIAKEKERGSLEVLLSSPVSQTVMVVAKTIPYLIVSLVNFLSILVISYFILDVPIRGSLFLIFLVTFVYIFLALSIGMLISAVSGSQRDAILMSGFGMMMPTIVFSGMIFPIANMPTILQWICKFVPANYYVSAVRKLMIQGVSFPAVAHETLILICMALVCTTFAILVIRPRLN